MAGQYKSKALMDRAVAGFHTQNTAKTPLAQLPQADQSCTKPSRGTWSDSTGRVAGRWFCWQADDGAKAVRWTVDEAAVVLGGEVEGTFQQAWEWWRLHAVLTEPTQLSTASTASAP